MKEHEFTSVANRGCKVSLWHHSKTRVRNLVRSLDVEIHLNSPGMHTTLFQLPSNVQTALARLQNNVLCLLVRDFFTYKITLKNPFNVERYLKDLVTRSGRHKSGRYCC